MEFCYTSVVAHSICFELLVGSLVLQIHIRGCDWQGKIYTGQNFVTHLARTCPPVVYPKRISLRHFAIWILVNGRQLLMTIFQNGLQVDNYWLSGPNTIYEIRIWFTNIVHIILNFLIILLAIVWVSRLQYQCRNKLVYTLLFFSGFL